MRLVCQLVSQFVCPYNKSKTKLNIVRKMTKPDFEKFLFPSAGEKTYFGTD